MALPIRIPAPKYLSGPEATGSPMNNMPEIKHAPAVNTTTTARPACPPNVLITVQVRPIDGFALCRPPIERYGPLFFGKLPRSWLKLRQFFLATSKMLLQA